MNRPDPYFPKLVPLNKFSFQQICRLVPETLRKMNYCAGSFKGFCLQVNSHKCSLDTRYFNGLLQLLQTLAAESFFRGESRNPITRNMKLFAATVHGSRIWIWMLNVAGFVNHLLFIWFQWFAVVQFLIVWIKPS